MSEPKWTQADEAALRRGVVRTPSGDFYIGRVKLLQGAECRYCEARKVHPRHVDEAPFCFVCGALQ